MALPYTNVITTTTATAVWVPNYNITPFNVNVTVIPGTSCTYSVQYTMDSVFASTYNPSSGNWINHPDGTAQTGTVTVQFVSPVMGIRVNQTAYGSGTTNYYILQAGVAQGV